MININKTNLSLFIRYMAKEFTFTINKNIKDKNYQSLESISRNFRKILVSYVHLNNDDLISHLPLNIQFRIVSRVSNMPNLKECNSITKDILCNKTDFNLCLSSYDSEDYAKVVNSSVLLALKNQYIIESNHILAKQN